MRSYRPTASATAPSLLRGFHTRSRYVCRLWLPSPANASSPRVWVLCGRDVTGFMGTTSHHYIPPAAHMPFYLSPDTALSPLRAAVALSYSAWQNGVAPAVTLHCLPNGMKAGPAPGHTATPLLRAGMVYNHTYQPPFPTPSHHWAGRWARLPARWRCNTPPFLRAFSLFSGTCRAPLHAHAPRLTLNTLFAAPATFRYQKAGTFCRRLRTTPAGTAGRGTSPAPLPRPQPPPLPPALRTPR